MRRIIVITLVLALAWMGWWVVGSTALDRALTSWFDARRAEGWVADYSDISVRGFPNRFDTRITDLRLADPDTGVAWEMPFFEILQLSYRPTEARLAWPNEITYATPYETIRIETASAGGFIGLRPVPSLELDRAQVILEDVALSSTLDWTVTLDEANLAVTSVGDDDTYRFGVALTGLTPSPWAKAVLDPAGLLPDVIEALHLDATVTFTGPLDRHTIEDARPQPTRIVLEDLSASWGDMTFRAVGRLDIDESGMPEGKITIRADEWRRLLDLAVQAGVLAEAFRPAIEGTLGVLAGRDGNAEALDADLVFRNGKMSFGRIPLGPAPRIVIR